MPEIEKLSIALPAEMAASIRTAVENGEYSSNSEVIREALRDWNYKRKLREEELAALQAKWQQAVTDESEGLDPETEFERLERRYESREKRRAR